MKFKRVFIFVSLCFVLSGCQKGEIIINNQPDEWQQKNVSIVRSEKGVGSSNNQKNDSKYSSDLNKRVVPSGKDEGDILNGIVFEESVNVDLTNREKDKEEDDEMNVDNMIIDDKTGTISVE